jgi:hypothetical protein
VAAGALSLLVELLSSGSDEGRADAAEALVNLMHEKDDNRVAVIHGSRHDLSTG